MRLVIALGGNALLPRGTPPDAAPQQDRIREVAAVLAGLAREHEVVIVHGNGPQVGLLAVESSSDASLARPYPLDGLVAETQGLLGYWLQQAIGAGLDAPVVTLVTQTVVDPDDPAFDHPTKPIGAACDDREAERLGRRHGWVFSRDGEELRRVVPSPRPVRVVEAGLARTLLETGATVVMAGGGGVPVVPDGAGVRGVEAVVDKDLVASLLARDLKADRLVVLTDVDAVRTDFGTPHETPLGRVGAEALEELLASGVLPAGSMAPKVEAVCSFVRAGGTGAIGRLEDARAVVAGDSGTQAAAPG